MNAYSEFEDVLDLGMHVEDMERKYFVWDWDWDIMIKFLVLCCPKSMIATVESEAEKFSEEFSKEQHAVFASQHPGGDIWDDRNGGYLFTTPVGKKVTRVLDTQQFPKYAELRKRILRAILGVGAEPMIDKKIHEGQGNLRVEAYTAKFQRWMKVLESLRSNRDERRYAELFLQGLNPVVKNAAVFESENLTLEEAYKAARMAAARASVLDGGAAAPQPAKWGIHPSRLDGLGLQHPQQTGPPLSAVALFTEQLSVGLGSDPEVFAIIGSLNAISTPMDYLKLIGSVAGIQLNESSLLTAGAQSLLPFHLGLKQALVNIRALRQLQLTIPLILPEQYLLHQKKGQGKVQPEKLTVMEEELRDARQELRELRGKKERNHKATELATVVEMLSEMRGERRERDNNYKRKREDSGDRDDHRRDDKNGPKRWQGQDSADRCFKCGQMGHRKQDCKDTEKRCIFCKSADHDVDKCQKRLDTICKQCNKKGHSAGFHRSHQCRKCGKEHSGLDGC